MLLPIVSAQENIFQSQELEMQTTISSEFQIMPTSSDYNIDYALVNLFFFPREDFQSIVLTQDTDPKAIETTDEFIQYRWESPGTDKLKFTLTSEIKTQNKIQGVKQKIQFPLENIPAEYLIYTKPSETIDSDKGEMIEQASELVEGTDDLYEAVFKLATWTENNVEYSLNTLTADVSQKASWVLMSRYGVCDELTSLFIAMARSLGIPARFVAGLAYTNYNNLNNWGPHAWAEIYFPDTGWVPFDLTYGEFGFVDPSHIILRYPTDPDESSNKFEWRGRNIELETQPLNLKVKLEKSTGKALPTIELKTTSLYDPIGFNSYNLIETEIKNLKDHYLAIQLQIVSSKEVEIIGRNIQQILLKPNEDKKIFWKIKLTPDLNKDYVYTFPVAVYSVTNISSQTSFISTFKDTVYSSENIDEIISSYAIEEKVYSTKINLECSGDKPIITISESANIQCSIKNQGNTLLKDLNICLYKDCKKTDLGISQEQNIEFQYSTIEPGKRSILIKAENAQVSKSDSIILEVLDTPKLSINNISYPKEVEFKQQYQLEFDLEKTSYSDPLNIEVKVIQNRKTDSFAMEKIERDQKIRLNLFGNNLKKGLNNIQIIVNYQDISGNSYSTQQNIQISLVNVTFFQNIQIWFYNLANWINNLF